MLLFTHFLFLMLVYITPVSPPKIPFQKSQLTSWLPKKEKKRMHTYFLARDMMTIVHKEKEKDVMHFVIPETTNVNWKVLNIVFFGKRQFFFGGNDRAPAEPPFYNNFLLLLLLVWFSIIIIMIITDSYYLVKWNRFFVRYHKKRAAFFLLLSWIPFSAFLFIVK